MILSTSTLDCAIEWLLSKIGTKDKTVLNEENGEQVDAVAAFCVWCLRLRFNLVEHGKDNTDSDDYPAWNNYKSVASAQLYRTVQKIAKLYRAQGGITPDYSKRTHKDISKWTYKRIFGPDTFIPIHVYVEELWRAVQSMFPELVKEEVRQDNALIDNDFLAFEMNNNALAKLLEVM